jgi:hypothetical protein
VYLIVFQQDGIHRKECSRKNKIFTAKYPTSCLTVSEKYSCYYQDWQSHGKSSGCALLCEDLNNREKVLEFYAEDC